MKRKLKKVTAFLLAAVLLSGVFQMAGIGTSMEVMAATSSSKVSVHDPSVMKGNDGKYYVYGTHFGVGVSSDLINWSSSTLTGITTSNCTTALSVPFAWMNSSSKNYENVWAPSVVYNSTMKKYCYYACVSVFGTTNSVIYFATADSPTGPFTYQDSIVYSGFTSATSGTMSYKNTNIQTLINAGTISGFNSSWATSSSYNCAAGSYPNAIDPAVFYDKDGRLWMTYGSFSGGIFILELNKSTGKPIYPGTDNASTNTDRYFGKRLTTSVNTGDANSHGNGEGPYITYDSVSGYYYLYITYGGLAAADGYNIRMYRATSPNGTYVDVSGTSGLSTANKGTKLFGNYKFACNDQAYLSGGHSSSFVDSDGKMYQLYHTRYNDGVGGGHYVNVHQMIRNEEGWPCTAPYRYQGETVSSTGYSVSDMTGTYEFINHGNTTLTSTSMDTIRTSIPRTLSVTLSSNGTISGDVNGYWAVTKNTPYVTMLIDNVQYKGVFLKQQNEGYNQQEVMTFTLVGKNNASIWGSKGSGSATVVEGIYNLVNVNSGLYMDVENAANTNGTNIRQWTGNGADAQKFKIVSNGDGYYHILTGASGYTKAVDIDSGSTADGANIMQWDYWGGDMQMYKIVQNGDSSYSFLTKVSSGTQAIEVYDFGTSAGTNISQWTYWGGAAQCWKLVPVSASVSDGVYYIKNVNSGLNLDIANGSSADGIAMQQWAYNGSAAQKFKLVSNGDGYYHILTGASSYAKCLDVEDGVWNDGASIAQYPYWGGDMQLFQIVQNSDGTYSFLTKCSGRRSAIEVYNFGTANGGAVVQWEHWDSAAQKWTLTATN